MCELTHGMAGERRGNGMGAAWERHAMCESAFSVTPCRLVATDVTEQSIATNLTAMQTAGSVVTFQKILVFR